MAEASRFTTDDITAAALKIVGKTFDELPITFHRQTVDNWNKGLSKIPRITEAVVEKNQLNWICVGKTLSEHSQKDSSLNESPNYFKAKPNFYYTRNLSLHRVDKEMSNQFQILDKCIECSNRAGDVSIPHRVFGWSEADFLKRCEIKKLVWIDILQWNVGPVCLERQKLKFDIEELKKYINMVFTAAKCTSDKLKPKLVAETWECMRNVNEFLQIETKLSSELASNTDVIRKYLNNAITINWNPNTKKLLNAKLVELEMQKIESDVFDPIEVRYQLRYQQLRANLAEEDAKVKRRMVKNELNRCKILSSTEIFCSQRSLDAMVGEIGQFKSRIAEYSKKYEITFEEIENSIERKRLAIEKWDAQQKFWMDEINRFHEEIEELHEHEIAEKKRVTERRLESVNELNKNQRKSKVKPKSKK